MSVSIPPTSGGCGKTHSRPVLNGAPTKNWGLDCAPCESHLKGDRKPQILRYELDPNTHTVLSQQRVADADPHWASTPYATPETPDERKSHKRQMEMGEKQLATIQALTAAKAAGINVPPEALFMIEHYLPGSIVQGTTECAEGHENPAGTKFCGECGMNMNAKARVDPPEPAGIPLDMLHIATLRKLCREAGLSDQGKKPELIERLKNQ
jgi:SAP domain